MTKEELDEYTKPKPKGEGFDDDDPKGKYICYNCVFMESTPSELNWCSNDSCRNFDHFTERKYRRK